jgi:hypothetical protein
VVFTALGKPAPPAIWWRWFVSWPLGLGLLAAGSLLLGIEVVRHRRYDLLRPAMLALFVVVFLGTACLMVFGLNLFAALYHRWGPGAAAAGAAALWLGLGASWLAFIAGVGSLRDLLGRRRPAP